MLRPRFRGTRTQTASWAINSWRLTLVGSKPAASEPPNQLELQFSSGTCWFCSVDWNYFYNLVSLEEDADGFFLLRGFRSGWESCGCHFARRRRKFDCDRGEFSSAVLFLLSWSEWFDPNDPHEGLSGVSPLNPEKWWRKERFTVVFYSSAMQQIAELFYFGIIRDISYRTNKSSSCRHQMASFILLFKFPASICQTSVIC